MATSYSPPHLSGTSEEKIVIKTEKLGDAPTLSTPRAVGEAMGAASPAQSLKQSLAQPITSNIAPVNQSRKKLHPMFRRAVSRHAKDRGSRSSRSRSRKFRSRPRRK